MIYEEVTRSCCSESTTTSDSYQEIRNRWHSAEDVRKVPKCNIQKQRLLQPTYSGKDGAGTGSDGDQSFEKPSHKQHQQQQMHRRAKRSNGPPSRAGCRSINQSFSGLGAGSVKLSNRDPPIITTTAATPQDSPNTTLNGGPPVFRQWDSLDTDASEKTDSTPSLLRPPSIVDSFRNLHPQRNSANMSNTINMTTVDVQHHRNQLSVMPIETRSSCPRLPLLSAADGENVAHQDSVAAVNPDTAQSNTATNISSIQKKSSFKRFSRSGSKKLKSKPKSDGSAGDVDIVLNNGRDATATAPDSPPPASATRFHRSDSITGITAAPPPLPVNHRIQNDTTKVDINKISPQNSFRRQLATRRMSALISSTQQLQLQQQHQLLEQFTRQHSLKKQRSGSVSSTTASIVAPLSAATLNYRRRMSSIEQAYEKSSNLNLYSVENMNSTELLNTKLGLADVLADPLKSNVAAAAAADNADTLVDSLPGVGNSGNFFDHTKKPSRWCVLFDPQAFAASRDSYSLYVFSEANPFRQVCTWFVNQKWFDNVILLFIALNCITLAMERPNIPPQCAERVFLGTANYVFTAVFTVEMAIKVVAAGMFYGDDAYFNSGWNIMDGSLVSISIIDLLMSLLSDSSPRIFGILRVRKWGGVRMCLRANNNILILRSSVYFGHCDRCALSTEHPA